MFCIISFLSFYCVTTNAENSKNQLDRIVHIYYFRDIAILDVIADSTQDQVGRVEKKIIIRRLIQPDNAAMKHLLLTTFAPPAPKLGEVIWTITPEELPVTRDTCIQAGIDDCDYDPNNHSALSGCYHSCVLFGPGFSKGEISPTGKYLLLRGNSFITVYNTESKDEHQLVSQQSHYIHKIHWLNDTQFSYQDGARHNKFQSSFDGVEEIVYDIPSRKVFRKRTLGKNEYNSSQYTEPN